MKNWSLLSKFSFVLIFTACHTDIANRKEVVAAKKDQVEVPVQQVAIQDTTPRKQGDANAQNGPPVKSKDAGMDKGIRKEDLKPPDHQTDIIHRSPDQHKLDSIQEVRHKQKMGKQTPKQ
jgi:hypothetical protein